MKKHRFIGTTTLIVITFTLTLIHALTAHAVDSSWTNTIGGNWTDPDWRNGVPGPTTNAFITNSLVAASSFTVTNDIVDNTFANLTMWNLSTGTNTLLNNSAGLNPTGNFILGQRAIFDLNGFSATIGGSLTVSNLGSVIVRGATLTNTGIASLLSGGSLLITNGTFQAGSSASGILTNGGTITIRNGGTVAVGIITNTGFITTFGGGVITGSVANLRAGAITSFGLNGINVSGSEASEEV